MTTYEILKKLNKSDKLSLSLKPPLSEILFIAANANKDTSKQLKGIIKK